MAGNEGVETLNLGNSQAAELALVETPVSEQSKTPEATAEVKAQPTTQEPTKAPEPDKPQFAWPAEFVAAHPELAGKFKDIETLAKSYENLEVQFTKDRQVKPGETPAPEPAKKLDPKAFFDKFVNDPIEAFREFLVPEIVEKVGTQVVLAQTVKELEGVYPELKTKEFGEKMNDLTPTIALWIAKGTPIKEAIEQAIKVVKGGNAPAPTVDMEKIRQQVREEERAKILGTVAERGTTGGSPGTGQPNLAEEVAGEILSVGAQPTLKLTSRS